MEKTAIEWLVEQLSNYDSKMIELFHNEINTAKEMHKQQIFDAYLDGFCDNDIGLREPEQYYTKTFKQD